MADFVTRWNLRLDNLASKALRGLTQETELLDKSLGELQKDLRKLKIDQKFATDRKEVERINRELDETQDKIRKLQALRPSPQGRGIGGALRGVASGAGQGLGQLASAVPGVGQLTSGLASAGPQGLAAAAVIGLGAASVAAIQAANEVAKFRNELASAFGLAEAQADPLAARLTAVGKVYGKTNEELLLAVKNFSATTGTDVETTLALVEQGFQAGADTNGEFLDNLREYGAQFKAAGFSAAESIGIITQGAMQGVYSDKAADFIKEFNLRIQEQTKPVQAALVGAFGADFSNRLLSEVNSGAISSAQALQQILAEMERVGLKGSKLQTLIADVFAAPGEDAGIDFIRSLGSANLAVDKLVDTNSKLVQTQRQQVSLNTELANSQLNLAKQTSDLGIQWEAVGIEIKTALIDLLAFISPLLKGLSDLLLGVGYYTAGLAHAMAFDMVGANKYYQKGHAAFGRLFGGGETATIEGGVSTGGGLPRKTASSFPGDTEPLAPGGGNSQSLATRPGGSGGGGGSSVTTSTQAAPVRNITVHIEQLVGQITFQQRVGESLQEARRLVTEVLIDAVRDTELNLSSAPG